MKKNQIILFTVLMLGIGIVCRLSDPNLKDFNSQNFGMLIWLISPIALTFIFRMVNKDWTSFGLKFELRKNWSWYIISLVLYPIIIGLTLIISLIFNSVEFTTSSPVISNTVLFSIVPLFIKNIFEEFTWRGYLTPQLEKMGISRFKNHIFVGLIWALWHLPFLDLMIRSYSQLNLWLAFPLVFISIIITAFVYGEIRLRSSSVWTAVILHTIGNYITAILLTLNIVKLVSGKEYIASPTMDNLAYIILISIVGVILFKLNSKVKSQ